MIVEAEQSHGLPSPTGDPGKLGCNSFLDRELGKVMVLNPSWRAGQDEMNCPSSNDKTGKRWWIFLSSVFCSTQVPSTDWVMPNYIGGVQSTLPNPPIQMLIILILEKSLIWAPPGPLKLMHNIFHHGYWLTPTLSLIPAPPFHKASF